jgi:hypothetical protein
MNLLFVIYFVLIVPQIVFQGFHPNGVLNFFLHIITIKITNFNSSTPDVGGM